MDTALDILQALGIGAAAGIRPFLPALLVGALASADLGVDFDGTDFAFLERPPFLIAMIVGLVLADVVRRRAGEEELEQGPGLAVVGAIALAVAGLLGAGSLADRDGPVIAGVLAAVAGAVLAVLALRPLFARVRSRLDAGAAGLLPLYREALALAAAGLAVLFPPLALIVVGALAFLLAGGRRREGEKYAGLRILR
jgi:FtsH-binding integral membrane protein